VLSEPRAVEPQALAVLHLLSSLFDYLPLVCALWPRDMRKQREFHVYAPVTFWSRSKNACFLGVLMAQLMGTFW